MMLDRFLFQLPENTTLATFMARMFRMREGFSLKNDKMILSNSELKK